MRVEMDAVAVRGAHAPLLLPTTVTARAGRALLVAGEPGAGHSAFALALAGRLVPHTGTVALDGRTDAGALQRAVALVDTPGVTEPDAVLPLATVVGEGLAVAGRPAGRAAVRRWLAERDAEALRSTRLERVPAERRTRLLAELAVGRPGVRVAVLTLPDRHGGAPAGWWRLAEQLAGTGLAVVVTCTRTSAELLGVPHAHLGGERPPQHSSDTLELLA